MASTSTAPAERMVPVGPRIVGRHLADAGVLPASAAFEQAAPWADRWPDGFLG